MTDTQKPELPVDLRKEIDALMMKSGEALRAGDMAASLALDEQVWDMLPDPKTGWDFYPQVLTNGIIEDAFENGTCHALDTWLPRFYAAYNDPDGTDPYTNKVAGHALYQCGRQEEGLEKFASVLRDHGPEWFTGHYRVYLDKLGG